MPYVDNLTENLLDLCVSIYNSIYNSSLQMLQWYNDFEGETFIRTGFTPLEIMFGAGIVTFLGAVLLKWILDIWPG